MSEGLDWCVCTYMCEREREREREKDGQREEEDDHVCTTVIYRQLADRIAR